MAKGMAANWGLAWMLGAISTAVACGGSVEKRSPDADGLAGSGAVPPAGGASGTGGPGGAGGSAGFVTCGRALCAPADFPPSSGQLSACCPAPSSGQAPGAGCGIDTEALSGFGVGFSPSCQPREQPGTPDAACVETVVLPFNGDVEDFSGCCRSDVGVCGYTVGRMGHGHDAFVVPLGCVSALLSPDSRPVVPCGHVPRPHHLVCECRDATKYEFCLVAGCGSTHEQDSVCAQACGGWLNRVSKSCSENDPRCG